MIRIVLGAFAAAVLTVGCQPQGDATRRDCEKVQGTWSLLNMVVDGQEVADREVRQTYRLTFEGDRYAIQIGNRTRWSGVYTIRNAANPKEMDITPADGEDAGKTFLGIYEEEGGVLTVCAQERERPKRFFGAEERAGLRLVLKRESP